MSGGNCIKKDAVSLQEAEGEPGCQDSRVTPILQWTAMDPTNPTTDEINKARVRAQNEYLGILFIRKSDPKCCGQLIVELQNNHTCGTDQYPQTLTRGYELLVNYHSPRPGGRID